MTAWIDLTPGVQNPNVVVTVGTVTVTSDLGSGWDSTVAGLGALDFSAIGGSPFGDYWPDGRGSLRTVHLESVETVGDSIANGFNATYLGAAGLVFYTSNNPGGAQLPITSDFAVGRDTIYVDLTNELGFSRWSGPVLGTIVHEALHESARIDDQSERFFDQLVAVGLIGEDQRTSNTPQFGSVLGALEHIIIRGWMDRLIATNEGLLRGYGSATLTVGDFHTELADLLGIDSDLLPATLPGATTPETASLGPAGLNELPEVLRNLGIIALEENDVGGIAFYLNSQGEIGSTAPGTGYSKPMLDFYAIEERDDNGLPVARTTFDATLRMLADWLGLDGEFGIQGDFARDGEGLDISNDSDAAAASGAGGASGNAPNLSDDDDDDNGGSKPPQIPYVNPDPKPTPGPVDVDRPKDPKVLNPILLDLDGNGIQLTDLTRSTVFMEGEEGLKHRTAWAGAGDGVLFYDTETVGQAGYNEISDIHEYVFTEWDPTAKDDLAALRSRFDTNGDGKLTGAELNNFKVMRTNADGSLTAQTMAQLGITQINLTEDTTQIALSDGSQITGQGTFVIGGVTRTLANATLKAEADGSRVVETASVTGGVRTVVQTGYGATGYRATRRRGNGHVRVPQSGRPQDLHPARLLA